MKKFVDTLIHIWKIEELRKKILYTLLLIFVYRLGTHITLPGVNPNLLDINKSGSNGILGLIDTFAGGAFSQASVFALGIMPYISASIFMQLATILIPQLQKIQKDGESGRKKIVQWTRYLTIIVTFLQAGAYVTYINTTNVGALIPEFSPYFWFSTCILLTAGTLFVMWLGEKITDRGIGNGTSLIIMVGILARLPQSFMQELTAKSTTNGGILVFLIEIIVLVAIILFTILLIQGVRRLPLSYAKQIAGAMGGRMQSARQYLPLKVNMAGVMPIIFAQAIMFFPTLISYTTLESGKGIARIFSDPKDPWHMVIYAFVVILFSFLYTALVFNPKQIADDLKRNNGFIPGIQPGKNTAEYIGTILDRITFPGAMCLALIGILPGFAMMVGITNGFASFFGGTSLLIMVAVIIDTLQVVETYLLMHRYEGLMKGGRIHGRNSSF